MEVLVIDGQGGRIGQQLIRCIRERFPETAVIAVGTNSIATAAMLRAGADAGATGENPVIVNVRDADVVAGPIGILAANALYGEISPAMACAVAECPAVKLLLPVNRCNNIVIGVREQPLSEYLKEAVQRIAALSQAE